MAGARGTLPGSLGSVLAAPGGGVCPPRGVQEGGVCSTGAEWHLWGQAHGHRDCGRPMGLQREARLPSSEEWAALQGDPGTPGRPWCVGCRTQLGAQCL